MNRRSLLAGVFALPFLPAVAKASPPFAGGAIPASAAPPTILHAGESVLPSAVARKFGAGMLHIGSRVYPVTDMEITITGAEDGGIQSAWRKAVAGEITGKVNFAAPSHEDAPTMAILSTDKWSKEEIASFRDHWERMTIGRRL